MSKTVRIIDYTPFSHRLEKLELSVVIDERVKVAARSRYSGPENACLELDGEFFALLSLSINGQAQTLETIKKTEQGIVLEGLPETFELVVETEFDPKENSQLSGIYQSGNIICSQCEAEGFRRITYFPDRPDVMTEFTVSIEANKADYPVLLSNGESSEEPLDNPERHKLRWHDPHLKPSYLFALVAGKLSHISRAYRTADGRDVRLRIFASAQAIGQCDFAMDCLVKAMRWDEKRFGLNYDLSEFMIVAVDAFNAGAMENKGLNIFNSALLLADPQTATDQDMQRVDAVVAHEYFHNWSGNRVTCRDWFQLSLKEGLTVFREQEYIADHYDRATARLEDIQTLRQHQFPEDDGPLLHPVRPASYVKIDNFYTATVYEKGAELIRMMQSIVGAEAFDKGIALYFQRHDGQAVCCEDFVAAMATASARDLTDFSRWYHTAGRPLVALRIEQDLAAQTLSIHYQQSIANNKKAAPLVLPCKIELIDARLKSQDFRQQNTIKNTILLDQTEGSVTLSAVKVPVAVAAFADLSAPVSIEQQQSAEQLGWIVAAASDGYSRLEAAHSLIKRAYWQHDHAARDAYLDSLAPLFAADAPPKLSNMLLKPPSFFEMISAQSEVDVEDVATFGRAIASDITEQYKGAIHTSYQRLFVQSRGKGYEAAATRGFMLSLLKLMPATESMDKAQHLYAEAENISERLAALEVLLRHPDPNVAKPALDDAYSRWSQHSVALDRWFSVQVKVDCDNAAQRVMMLLAHPEYQRAVPNRVRAVLAQYVMANPIQFLLRSDIHAPLFTELSEIDALNPVLSARILSLMSNWRQYHSSLALSLKEGFLQMRAAGVSENSAEIIDLALGDR